MDGRRLVGEFTECPDCGSAVNIDETHPFGGGAYLIWHWSCANPDCPNSGGVQEETPDVGLGKTRRISLDPNNPGT
jgi:hypothetical protein